MLRRHQLHAYPGSIHFVTTVTRRRGSWFTDPGECTVLLELFEGCRAKQDLVCFGYVLMPDHSHVLLYQETVGGCVARCMEAFKKFSSLRLKPASYPPLRLWQVGYDDVPVPGSHAIWTKLRYIHWNPIKGGIVDTPDSYLWSSADYYWNGQEGIVKVVDPW
jgi:putative transposase